MSLTVRLLNYLSKRSRGTVWLITLSTIMALGLIDTLTGSKIAITFFYLLPVSLASWSLGKTPGRAAALCSAVIVEASDLSGGGDADVPLLLWNTAARLAVFLVVANLISEFRHLLKHQTELSLTDSLTGILNRRAFQEAGESELKKMRGHGQPITLAFMDIDDFKTINDASGHLAGDALLTRVAECLKSQLWGTDAVARLGGDEYALLLPHTSLAAAQKVLPRLKDTLVNEMAEAKWPVTFSIGAVTCEAPPPDIEELIEMADQLMYAAKHHGKSRIEYGLYTDEYQRDADGSDERASERLPQAQ